MTFREIFRLGPKPVIQPYWSYLICYQFGLVTRKGMMKIVYGDGIYRIPFPIMDDNTLENVRATIAEQEAARFGGVHIVGNLPEIKFLQVSLIQKGKVRLTAAQAARKRELEELALQRAAEEVARDAAERDARDRLEAKAKGEDIESELEAALNEIKPAADAAPAHAEDCPNGFGAKIQLGEKCEECGAAWIPAPGSIVPLKTLPAKKTEPEDVH